MIPMTLGEVARAMGAECAPADRAVQVRRVVIDSREVRPGDLFFALRGQQTDGHRFVAAAAAAGAAACICNLGVDRPDGQTARQLEVPDTVAALGSLAAYYRQEIMSPDTVVVGVTGSNGKTTTKCMIDHVLGCTYPGRASPKSFNNSLGVPLTLLSSEPGDRYLVAEIGTNAPGEIAELASIAAPHVGVITSIGEAHLEGLGSLEAIAEEKTALVEGLPGNGLAVVNIDRAEILPWLTRNPRVRLVTVGFGDHAKLRVTRVSGDIHYTLCEFDGRHRVTLPMPGRHHAGNAAAAFAVARWFGVDPGDILQRLASFRPPAGRTRVLEVGDITIVDDTYNANPSSVFAAVSALRGETSRRRVFVLGDMLELGQTAEAHHERVVRSILESDIDLLVTVGPASGEAARSATRFESRRVTVCDNIDAAADVLQEKLRPADVVWVKASRGMGLDRLVARLESCRPTEAAVA